MATPFRELPSVDRLLADARLRDAGSRETIIGFVREVLLDIRQLLHAGGDVPTLDGIVEAVAARARDALRPAVRPLINATGVIIHTNLGRAPLAREAIEAMEAVSRGYSSLEFEIQSGKRGSRHTILEPLLRRITGAEAAMAVNNNAAAVMLALSALAAGKEVVISRGELVEIGGGFRIPDVMRQSRARLVEVGTTNRTRPADYEAAAGSKTAALMRVHRSNFKIVGFSETPLLRDLAQIAHERGLVLIDDLGSGCLLDTTKYGLAAEPTPQASIAAGADIVMFSGDKLLGGPQGGLIAGRKAAVDRMKRHPLARAVRLDKASIAGLEATLAIHLRGEAEMKIPVWRMIAMPLDVIEARARAIAERVEGAAVVAGRSMVGGGALPQESLATWLVSVSVKGVNATVLAARLRGLDIVARVERGRVLVDPRTVDAADDARLTDALMRSVA